MFTVKQGLGLSSSSSSSSSSIEDREELQQQQQRPWWKQQQRSSVVVGFASIGGGGLAAPAFSFAPPLPRGKKETRTSTDFPSELCHVQKKSCPVLTGVG